MVRPGRAMVVLGTAMACAAAVHTAWNLRSLRRPASNAPEVHERVSVLIPARDEEAHIGATVSSVLAQSGVADLTVRVLDDGSSDATAAVVADLAATDPRVSLDRGSDDAPPPGWLGKPWACARLADSADGSVLVFVDADVVLEPHAVRALVATLRENGLAMVAPYPRQVAMSWLERLVQPMVTWSWAATMPLSWAEGSLRPSLSAANGQLLVLDAQMYRAIDGHESVQGDVIEDVALMRAIKRGGGYAATVDGSALATCRMYDSPAAVVDGYAKSLWSAFNGPVGSAAVVLLLGTAFVLPPVAAVLAPTARTRAIGVIGYAAGVTSRVLVARRVGERVLPDCLAHPFSVVAFAGLTGMSWYRHRRGTNAWKGRPVTPAAEAGTS